jgi:hypothetical protein
MIKPLAPASFAISILLFKPQTPADPSITINDG